MHVIEEVVKAALLANKPKKIFVAYSGGSDSTALLVALNNVVDSLPIVALHVNHGLQAESDKWEKHCVSECRRLGVKIHVGKVDLSGSNNIEAAAREKRYAFFESFIEEGDFLFVGHHLQDQIETALMRIFQGRGLIQMPDKRNLGKGSLIRPFLKFKPEILRKYISKLGCSWVEDVSNSDQTFSRNYIRSVILSSVGSKWPDYAQDFDRVLSRLRNVEKILTGFYEKLPDLLDVTALPDDMDAKLIWMRGFLENKGHFGLRDRQLKLFLNKIEKSETAVIELDGQILGHYRGSLYYEPLYSKFTSDIRVAKFPYELDIGWGVLSLEEVAEKESQSFFCAGDVIIKFGSGNRKIKLGRTGPNKSVKNLLNEKLLPQWRRPNFPLICSQNALLCLPDIGVNVAANSDFGPGIKCIKATILDK